MSDLTPRQRAQIMALENLSDDQIDMTEIPETLDWSNAVRGKFYRPGEKHVGRAIGSTTDTSEKGLERLICEALTGRPCDSAGDEVDARAAVELQRRLDVRRPRGLRPGVLRRPGPALRLPPRYPARRREVPGPRRGQSQRGAGSWPASRVRSRSGAPSTCCARASSTGRARST